jgi:prophage regulatory protein
MSTNDLEVVREAERFRLTKLSRVQWWRLERDGKVPKRIRLGANSIGWIKSEIEGWIRERVASR